MTIDNTPQEKWSFDEGFSSRFNEVVSRAGMSNAQFADYLGLSRGFISDVSRGTKRPGLTFLHTLHQKFDVSIDWLLYGHIGNTEMASEVNLFQTLCSLMACIKANKNSPNSAYSILIDAIAQGTGREGQGDPLLVALRKNYPCTDNSEFAFSLYQKIIRLGDPYRHLGMAIAEVQSFVDKE